MQLQGKKIYLRPILSSDLDLIYKWENDTSNWPVSGTKKPFTKKEIKDFIANQKDIYLDKQLRLMICLSAQKAPARWKGLKDKVGCIDLYDFDKVNFKAGIGILIDKKHRKNGYASEALPLLIKYCFKTLNLHNLHCSISEENDASIKLFQKHKFKITGKEKDVCHLQLANKRS